MALMGFVGIWYASDAYARSPGCEDLKVGFRARARGAPDHSINEASRMATRNRFELAILCPNCGAAGDARASEYNKTCTMELRSGWMSTHPGSRKRSAQPLATKRWSPAAAAGCITCCERMRRAAALMVGRRRSCRCEADFFDDLRRRRKLKCQEIGAPRD